MTAPSPAVVYRLHQVLQPRGDSFQLEIPALEVRQGESLGLVGPIGAGKSTLLRLLTGLAPPEAGQIRFQDSLISREGLPLEQQRRIAMVHQRPLVLADSVRYNVEYPLGIRGQANRRQRANAVLGRLGLTDLAMRHAHSLSGGQAQLVGLARALVAAPEVLLLDEPTAHLDPAHVELVEEVVRQERASRPLTIVWATHNLFQARRMTDRMALLLSGQLVELADTRTFFNQPADERTAQFVQGKMVY